MSSGKVFQNVEAATRNERRPTVDRRYDGTSSCSVKDDRRLRDLHGCGNGHNPAGFTVKFGPVPAVLPQKSFPLPLLPRVFS